MLLKKELIRNEGIKTNNTELKEYKYNFKLNKDVSIRNFTSFLNDNKLMKLVLRINKKVKKEETARNKEVLKQISKINILDGHQPNYSFFECDLDRKIYLFDGQYIELNYNQSIDIYIDDMDYIDIFFKIDFDDIELNYHIYLKSTE